MKFVDWLVETWRMPWSTSTIGVRSREYDKILQYIMDNSIQPKFTSETRLVATFGATKLWLGNYPYAFGCLYEDKRIGRPLPTLRMTYRFNKYVLRYSIQKELENAAETSNN